MLLGGWEHDSYLVYLTKRSQTRSFYVKKLFSGIDEHFNGMMVERDNQKTGLDFKWDVFMEEFY